MLSHPETRGASSGGRIAAKREAASRVGEEAEGEGEEEEEGCCGDGGNDGEEEGEQLHANRSARSQRSRASRCLLTRVSSYPWSGGYVAASRSTSRVRPSETEKVEEGVEEFEEFEDEEALFETWTTARTAPLRAEAGLHR